jgi:hypothetical protein
MFVQFTNEHYEANLMTLAGGYGELEMLRQVKGLPMRNFFGNTGRFSPGYING